MSKEILIASDSTTDLSPELIERYGFKTVPLGVTLGGKTYKDGVDITPDMIYEHNKKTGELPKTSACNIGELTDFFSAVSKEAKEVIFFTLSSKMSSNFNNARIAAEEFDNVYVVDAYNLSTGGGLLMLTAYDMSKAGKKAAEIVEEIEKIKLCVDASFVIDKLDYLHQGGRCSSLAVLGANLLKLKPCIAVKDGAMGVDKKYRGKFETVVKEYAAERLADKDDIVNTYAFVTHAGCSDEVEKSVLNVVKETGIFKEVFVTRASCTISSHCGSDCIGVLFIRKSPIV